MSPRTFVLAILGVIFFKYSLSFTVNQVKKAYKPFRTTSSIQLHFHAPAFLVLTRISDSFNDLKDKFNSLPTMSYNDFQNAAIIGAGLTFLAVEKRPIGGVRDDLVEVRKSALIKNNLGVFSKAFIPEGTVIGTYPGYIRSMQGVFDHSKSNPYVQIHVSLPVHTLNWILQYRARRLS